MPTTTIRSYAAGWTPGVSYRAIAYREGANLHCSWIGAHEAYNNLLSRFT